MSPRATHVSLPQSPLLPLQWRPENLEWPVRHCIYTKHNNHLFLSSLTVHLFSHSFSHAHTLFLSILNLHMSMAMCLLPWKVPKRVFVLQAFSLGSTAWTIVKGQLVCLKMGSFFVKLWAMDLVWKVGLGKASGIQLRTRFEAISLVLVDGKRIMAPGTEFSLQTNGIDSVSLKGTGVSAMEDQNNNNNNDNTLEGLAPVNTRKPPRSLTVMRHCTSSAWLAESVSNSNSLCHPHFPFFL